jgi:cytochrome c oxidase subunit III
MKYRIIADVSSLPDNAFGSRTLMWWGVIGFICIESSAFLLAAGAYFFLMNQTTPWPPNHPAPSLMVSGLLTVLMVLSEIPNVWAQRAAHSQRLVATRVALIIMCAVGLALIALRLIEFQTLQVRWDQDAYGSVVWALLFIHTFHLVTDVADSVVLTTFMFTHEVTPTRFADVADNSLYWHFVVAAWLPVYALIYWVPRMTQ